MPATLEAVLEMKEVKDWLNGLSSFFGSLQKEIKQLQGVVNSVVMQDVMDHFKTETGSRGPWAPWSSSYTAAIQGSVAFRNVNGRTIPIEPSAFKKLGIKPPRKPGLKLQDTGRLRNSVMPAQTNPSGAMKWVNNAKTKKGFPYAAAHDIGGPKLPKRDFMWLSDKAMEKVANLTLEHILNRTKY